MVALAVGVLPLVRARQIEAHRCRVLSQREWDLKEEAGKIHLKLGVHHAIYRSLAQVYIDLVEVLARWDVPRHQAEAFPHEERVSWEELLTAGATLPPVRSFACLDEFVLALPILHLTIGIANILLTTT